MLLPIGHIRYINILTWLRGFRDKLPDLVLFSLFPSLFWELWDKRNFKNLQFWPESLGFILEYWYIECGPFAPFHHKIHTVPDYRLHGNLHCVFSNRERLGTNLIIMGLATIDPHSYKVQTKVYKILKFRVNRLESKQDACIWKCQHLQRHVLPSGRCSGCDTFLC